MERKSILLVEDDPVVKDLIRDSLEKEYEILEASTYSEAINQSRNHIDLAIIDYSLPDGDGFEVLKKLREKRPALPAIMITAYSSEDVAIKAVRTVVNEYIKKPLSLRHLKTRVSEILEGKKSDGYPENAESREEFIIEGIAVYIENNYMKDINRGELAKMVSIDRYKLSRAFNERIGQSLSSYLNSIRIKKAAELLKNRDLNITEIGYFVGFKSIEHFSRLFKALYGVSPKEFREKLKQ